MWLKWGVKPSTSMQNGEGGVALWPMKQMRFYDKLAREMYITYYPGISTARYTHVYVIICDFINGSDIWLSCNKLKCDLDKVHWYAFLPFFFYCLCCYLYIQFFALYLFVPFLYMKHYFIVMINFIYRRADYLDNSLWKLGLIYIHKDIASYIVRFILFILFLYFCLFTFAIFFTYTIDKSRNLPYTVNVSDIHHIPPSFQKRSPRYPFF